jgi:hypothetical protein
MNSQLVQSYGGDREMAANNRGSGNSFFSFEHVANLYGLYQYVFSAKGVFRGILYHELISVKE